MEWREYLTILLQVIVSLWLVLYVVGTTVAWTVNKMHRQRAIADHATEHPEKWCTVCQDPPEETSLYKSGEQEDASTP